MPPCGSQENLSRIRLPIDAPWISFCPSLSSSDISFLSLGFLIHTSYPLYALILQKHRNKIDPQYKRKIENIVRKPDRTEADEKTSPCPMCRSPVCKVGEHKREREKGRVWGSTRGRGSLTFKLRASSTALIVRLLSRTVLLLDDTWYVLNILCAESLLINLRFWMGGVAVLHANSQQYTGRLRR